MALLKTGQIDSQNNPLQVNMDSYCSKRQSMATIGLRAANGRALNEPALCCIFAVSQPTSN